MTIDGAVESSWVERTLLVLGGSSGTGLELVRAAAARGARVAVGTRQQERFAAVRDAMPGAALVPFVADMTAQATVEEAVATLLGEQGFVPTDVVVASAGGMETFLKPVLTDLLRVQRLAGAEEREARLEVLRAKVAEGVGASLEAARAVNADGPMLALRLLTPHLRPGARIVFLSSLWSSIYGRGAGVPAFYEATARTKHELEIHLEALAPGFAERGVHVAILSGHLILDTDMGRVISKFIAPLLPPADQETFAGQFIRKEDVVAELVHLLEEDPAAWRDRPEWRFVFGPGPEVVRRLPDDLPLFRMRFPI